MDAVLSFVGPLPATGRTPTVTIDVRAATVPLPESPPDAAYDGRRLWRDGDDVLLQDATGVAARAGPQRTVIATGSAAPGTEGVGVRRIFLAAVGHMLAFHERFLVHGAALVLDDLAVLVLGSTGAGKSTVALAALGSGVPVLADDLVLLRARHGGLDVMGLPRPPAVPMDLAHRLESSAKPVAGDPRNRAELPPVLLRDGWAPAAGVLVCAHGSTPDGALDAIGWRDVLHLFIGSFPPAEHPDHLRRVLPVAASAARLPAARLRLGAKPGSRLSGAVACLAEFSRRLSR